MIGRREGYLIGKTPFRLTFISLTALAVSMAFSADALSAPRCDGPGKGAATGKACDSANSGKGASRSKEVALKRLRKNNAAPNAKVAIGEIIDRHVELDASGSTDDDGFIEYYTYRVMDGDTGDVVVGPVRSREPFARLTAGRSLPSNLVVSVSVEDDLQATDSSETGMALSQVDACENSLFSCSANSANTSLTCTPKASTLSFTTDDLLGAAQSCGAFSIKKSTTLQIFAGGGAGGRGGNAWPFKGGAGGKGGVAGMATTIDDMNQFQGLGESYCYGLGSSGGHSGTNGGGGGASTLLFLCDSNANAILLVAGGGGGGGQVGGTDGGDGASAFAAEGSNACGSGIGNNCPPPFGKQGANGGGYGGGYGEGGKGTGGNDTTKGVGWGADGLGGEGGKAKHWGNAGFYQGDPNFGFLNIDPDVNNGKGGSQEKIGGGAGGGGYGAGAAGGANKDIFKVFLGGGGGGSYASPSTVGSVSRGLNNSKGYLFFRFIDGS